jgi:hypothetical protein
MPPRATVIAITPLGRLLEGGRIAKGMSRRQAYEAAGTSRVQWTRLITQLRKFDLKLVKAAAEAVGVSVAEAFGAIGIVVVPDGSRVLTEREFEELLQAS